MSISGISTSSACDQTNLSALYQQRRRDFKAIEAAVQGGDLTGAQQAVTTWQKDVQALQSARGESADPGTYSPPSNQFKTDVKALVDAIQGGDITKAQSALTTLEQDRQGGGSGGGQGLSGIFPDLQNLLKAVSSGDLTGAQQAGAAVQKDIQAFATHGHHHHSHHKVENDGDSDNQNTTTASTGGTSTTGSSFTSSSSGSGSVDLGTFLSAQTAYTASQVPPLGGFSDFQA